MVAGVDSYLQQEVLDHYVELRRVLTASNSNGFLPGEAGCAVLVAPAGDAPAPSATRQGHRPCALTALCVIP